MSTKDIMSAADFRNYLRARDIAFTIAYNRDAQRPGEQPEQIGLNLRGPRGSKHFAAQGQDGTYDAFSTKLWWDSIEYASQKIRDRRAEDGRRAVGRGRRG